MKTWSKLFLVFVAMPVMATAQNMNNSKEKTEYIDVLQLWRNTNNAAGMTLDTIVNRGVTFINVAHKEGSHTRIQEGKRENGLSITSESYQKIGKYLYGYGRFSFDMGRIFERSWSDVIRTYNSNPYISGSAIKGRYDFQNIDLKASLSTVQLGNLTYGLMLDYKVGDLSRLRDPRSRINLADYAITPSATYSFGNKSLGLALHYRRRKEKLPSVTTVQTDPNLKYYVMKGVEKAVGTIGGYNGYERQYTQHEFGGELSFNVKGSNINTLTTVYYNNAHEDVYGDTKYQPGKFFTQNVGLKLQNRIYANNKIHAIDVNVAYSPSYADEYKQVKQITKDPTTGIESSKWVTLIEYKQMYKVKDIQADVHYRMNITDKQNKELSSYIGAIIKYSSVKDEYVLPYSNFKYNYAEATLEGGVPVYKKNERSLWIEAQGGYHKKLKSEMLLSNESNDYAQQVLLPDMNYYNASYCKAHLQVQYQLPLTIKEQKRIWFVKLTGDYLKTNQHTDASLIGLSLGIYH